MNQYIMYQDLISGAVAGVVSRTMVAPIELYRVQRQNSFIPNTTIRDVFKREGIWRQGVFFWNDNELSGKSGF